MDTVSPQMSQPTWKGWSPNPRDLKLDNVHSFLPPASIAGQDSRRLLNRPGTEGRSNEDRNSSGVLGVGDGRRVVEVTTKFAFEDSSANGTFVVVVGHFPFQ